jgi:flagellar protein FlgJ
MSSASTPSVTDFGNFAGLRASARANDPESLRKVAQQFEALFTQQLLKSARAASLGSDLMGGEQTEFYNDLFDQQMALHLSSGKGLGIADLLVRQLQQRSGANATKSTDQTFGAHGEAMVELPARPSAQATIPLRSEASSPNNFVEQIRPHAERAAQALGVPARVIMAQAALETGWGRQVPGQAQGTPSFNFFGIKADARWEGPSVEVQTHEFIDGRMQPKSAAFRAYDSIGEAFDDYVNFLQSNPRYADALRHQGDSERFASGLQKAGYASDPSYAQKVLKIAQGPTMQRGLGTDSTSPTT